MWWWMSSESGKWTAVGILMAVMVVLTCIVSGGNGGADSCKGYDATGRDNACDCWIRRLWARVSV